MIILHLCACACASQVSLHFEVPFRTDHIWTCALKDRYRLKNLSVFLAYFCNCSCVRAQVGSNKKKVLEFSNIPSWYQVSTVPVFWMSLAPHGLIVWGLCLLYECQLMLRSIPHSNWIFAWLKFSLIQLGRAHQSKTERKLRITKYLNASLYAASTRVAREKFFHKCRNEISSDTSRDRLWLKLILMTDFMRINYYHSLIQKIFILLSFYIFFQKCWSDFTHPNGWVYGWLVWSC